MTYKMITSPSTQCDLRYDPLENYFTIILAKKPQINGQKLFDSRDSACRKSFSFASVSSIPTVTASVVQFAIAIYVSLDGISA